MSTRKFEEEIIKNSESNNFDDAIREWYFYKNFTGRYEKKWHRERRRNGIEIPKYYCPCGRQVKYSIVIINQNTNKQLRLNKGCFNKYINLIGIINPN